MGDKFVQVDIVIVESLIIKHDCNMFSLTFLYHHLVVTFLLFQWSWYGTVAIVNINLSHLFAIAASVILHIELNLYLIVLLADR